MFKQNTQNLMKNLIKPDTPLELDIVLEGGGFNGCYEYGVLLLLKEMEKQNYIKINRISGASIGSMLGFCYLTDNLHIFLQYYNKIRTHWKENTNLTLYKTMLTKEINALDTSIFKQIQNNKLFITYYDICEKKQLIQHIYTDKQDLIDGIIKSSYIPFIFDNNPSLECSNTYIIDGGQPFIFKNRSKNDRKILYVSINQINKLNGMISTKNEITPNGRILEGLLDAYQFFHYQKRTAICSYVNNWWFYDFIIIRIKQCFLMGFVYFISGITSIHTFITPFVKDIGAYRHFTNILFNLYKDFILFYCF